MSLNGGGSTASLGNSLADALLARQNAMRGNNNDW